MTVHHLHTLKKAFVLGVSIKHTVERIMADESHLVAMSCVSREAENRRWFMRIFDLATSNERGGHKLMPAQSRIELTIEPMLVSSVFLFDGWMVVPLEKANELVWFDKSGRRRETRTKLDNISNVLAIYSSVLESPIRTGK